MKKAYWIIGVDIIHQEAFSRYAEHAPSVIEKYGGKFLVRAGPYTCVEGSTRSRNTVIEFPSYDAALACWNSREYQEVKSVRRGAAEFDLVIIEGVIEGREGVPGA